MIIVGSSMSIPFHNTQPLIHKMLCLLCVVGVLKWKCWICVLLAIVCAELCFCINMAEKLHQEVKKRMECDYGDKITGGGLRLEVIVEIKYRRGEGRKTCFSK